MLLQSLHYSSLDIDARALLKLLQKLLLALPIIVRLTPAIAVLGLLSDRALVAIKDVLLGRYVPVRAPAEHVLVGHDGVERAQARRDRVEVVDAEAQLVHRGAELHAVEQLVEQTVLDPELEGLDGATRHGDRRLFLLRQILVRRVGTVPRAGLELAERRDARKYRQAVEVAHVGRGRVHLGDLQERFELADDLGALGRVFFVVLAHRGGGAVDGEARGEDLVGLVGAHVGAEAQILHRFVVLVGLRVEVLAAPDHRARLVEVARERRGALADQPQLGLAHIARLAGVENLLAVLRADVVVQQVVKEAANDVYVILDLIPPFEHDTSREPGGPFEC